MSKKINQRRHFLGIAAMTIAATQLGRVGSAIAQSSKPKPAVLDITKLGTNTSFDSLKQVNAGVLNVGYAEMGSANDRPVILLHGWPYDIHSYSDVAPLLATAGYWVIIPYLRGYGTTHFLASETFRNGQQSAIAADIIALMDILGIEQAILSMTRRSIAAPRPSTIRITLASSFITTAGGLV